VEKSEKAAEKRTNALAALDFFSHRSVSFFVMPGEAGYPRVSSWLKAKERGWPGQVRP
jgi:hypothetical protein